MPVRIPVIEMIEIGAGGGSIAHVDQVGRLNIGPESAGALPGAACYGKGGTKATVTDANLLLGRVDPDAFAEGKMRLDTKAAEDAMTHPDCPMCDGEGELRVVFHASAMLDKDAALAFDGLHITQNGMKVMTIERMAASEKIAKHLGMFRQEPKDEVVDALSAMLARIQQKGSKALLNGGRDGSTGEDSARLADEGPPLAPE